MLCARAAVIITASMSAAIRLLAEWPEGPGEGRRDAIELLTERTTQ